MIAPDKQGLDTIIIDLQPRSAIFNGVPIMYAPILYDAYAKKIANDARATYLQPFAQSTLIEDDITVYSNRSDQIDIHYAYGFQTESNDASGIFNSKLMLHAPVLEYPLAKNLLERILDYSIMACTEGVPNIIFCHDDIVISQGAQVLGMLDMWPDEYCSLRTDEQGARWEYFLIP